MSDNPQPPEDMTTDEILGEMAAIAEKIHRSHMRAFIEREQDALAAVTTPALAARVFALDLAFFRERS